MNKKKTPKRERLGECGLCQKESKLSRSHIIPEHAYKDLKEDGKFCIVDLDDLDAPVRFLQTGYWERLLCGKCEAFLNHNYEARFNEFWFHGRPLDSVVFDSKGLGEMNVPEPGRFQLYHLSILLRADLASRGEWSAYNLGRKHRDRLRKAVLEGDEESAFQYPVIAVASNLNRWEMVNPSSRFGRHSKFRIYGIRYGGCLWLFFVAASADLVSTVVHQLALKRSGTLPLLLRKPSFL